MRLASQRPGGYARNRTSRVRGHCSLVSIQPFRCCGGPFFFPFDLDFLHEITNLLGLFDRRPIYIVPFEHPLQLGQEPILELIK
jgi:hypothetical protein